MIPQSLLLFTRGQPGLASERRASIGVSCCAYITHEGFRRGRKNLGVEKEHPAALLSRALFLFPDREDPRGLIFFSPVKLLRCEAKAQLQRDGFITLPFHDIENPSFVNGRSTARLTAGNSLCSVRRVRGPDRTNRVGLPRWVISVLYIFQRMI